MKHLNTQKGDGNGTPAGVFFSWQALAVLVAVLGLLGNAVDVVRQGDLRLVESKFAVAAVTDARQDKEIAELQIQFTAWLDKATEAENRQKQILEALQRLERMRR